MALSLNDICLCPCPVLILYVYKLYSFTKHGISILIPSKISSSFGDSLEPDLLFCSARCSQSLVVAPCTMAVNLVAGQT